MSRPCTCDMIPPAGEPYSTRYCRLCYLYHNDPAYAAAWDGEAAHQPPAPWPRWATALASKRVPGELGAGDTLARLLGRGGKLFKVAYRKLTGRDCGCEDRQDRMNAAYPYPPPR